MSNDSVFEMNPDCSDIIHGYCFIPADIVLYPAGKFNLLTVNVISVKAKSCSEYEIVNKRKNRDEI